MGETKTELKTITLSDGRIATIGDFKGKHLLAAQRAAGGEQEKVPFGMIAACVTIDGAKIVIEDLEEMDGRDVFKLIGELNENF